MVLPTQSSTPLPPLIAGSSDAQSPYASLVGIPLSAVRTPALVINKKTFKLNCDNMFQRAQEWGTGFRAHVKSHKTVEGVAMQCQSDAGTTGKVVVSTMMEAREVVRGGLVKKGIVDDILYPLPLPLTLLSDLSTYQQTLSAQNPAAVLRVMIDHISQVEGIIEYEEAKKAKGEAPGQWSVFIKANAGGNRAGIYPDSPTLPLVIKAILSTPYIDLYGFYSHAGHSYASTTTQDAVSYLRGEAVAVNDAARVANEIINSAGPGSSWKEKHAQKVGQWSLSVGATPTANAASGEVDAKKVWEACKEGVLELHAGCYPLHDLQQLHTSLIEPSQIACSVLSTVISHYPGRAVDGGDEYMCDAGGIAMSKDGGPEGGFGRVLAGDGEGWRLGRTSQEHGLLVAAPHLTAPPLPLTIGGKIKITPQHACMTLAAYPMYYVVEDDSPDAKVIEVWVPWKGW